MIQTASSDRSLKNIIINPKFQLRVLSLVVLIGALGQGTLLWLLALIFSDFPVPLNKESISSLDHCLMIMSEFKFSLYQTIIISFVLSTLIYTIVMIVVTHRIAGPIFKMTRFFEQVAKDPTKDSKIHFRKGDYFSELAEAYNKRFEKK